MIAKTKKQSLKIVKKIHPLSRKKLRNGRLVIELLNVTGEVIARSVGPTTAQQRREHALGNCSAFCGFCSYEAEKYIKQTRPSF